MCRFIFRMAEAVSSEDNLRSLLECCICTEKFKDPRILPCIHTFCLKCLEQTGKGKSPGASMPCPLCRTEFWIPASGLVGIQKNFFMEQLLSMYHLSKPEAKRDPCDACLENLDNEDDVVAVAGMFCMECNQKLCDLCQKWHIKMKATKNHELIELGNTEQISRVSRNLTRSLCACHEGKPIEMYCFECCETICMICYAEEHHGHKCSGVGKVGDGFRLQLESCTANISKCCSRREHELIKLDKVDRIISNQHSTLKEDILQRAAQLKSTVDKHANKLLLKANSIKSRNLKEIEIRREEVSRYLVMLESYKQYAAEITGKGSSVEICRNFQEMKTRACELERNCLVPGSNPPNVKHTFLAIPLGEELKKSIENMFGDLSIANETSQDIQSLWSANTVEQNSASLLLQNRTDTDKGGSSNVSVELKSVTQTPQISRKNETLDKKSNHGEDELLANTFTIDQEDGEIAGLAWLENQIYVVCRDSTEVLAFQDHAPFSELVECEIEINEMKSVYDMTACKRSRSIFIVDSGNSCVYKIRMPTKEMKKFMIRGKPMGISVTESDDLLLVVLIDSIYYLVVCQSSTCKQKMLISFSEGIECPSNAVQLLNGNFILSYQNDRSSGLHKIREFSENNFILTLDPSISAEFLRFKNWWPYHLSIDEEGRIFVADNSADSDGVIRLNSDLTDYEIIMTKDGHKIDDPMRLCYIREKQQLIVGLWSQFGGPARVSVLDLRP